MTQLITQVFVNGKLQHETVTEAFLMLRDEIKRKDGLLRQALEVLEDSVEHLAKPQSTMCANAIAAIKEELK